MVSVQNFDAGDAKNFKTNSSDNTNVLQATMSSSDVNLACTAMGNASLQTAQHFVNTNLTPAEQLLGTFIQDGAKNVFKSGNDNGDLDSAQAAAMKARAQDVMGRISSGNVNAGDIASLRMGIYGRESYIASGYTENAAAEAERFIGKKDLSSAHGRDVQADTRYYHDADHLKLAIDQGKRPAA